MQAKKFIENKKEGEYEIIKNHIIDIPVDIFDVRNLVDDMSCFDDPDMAYVTYGVALGWECDDIYSVDINKFIEAVEGYYEDERPEDKPEYAMKLLEVLKKYPGYDLYP